MKVNFHTIEFMSAEADMGCKFDFGEKDKDKMKLTYLITPFETDEYLVRCINALHRQTGRDYEIILAENHFDNKQETLESDSDSKEAFSEIGSKNKIMEFLEQQENLIRISDAPVTQEEKLEEAVRIFLDSQGEFLVFLNVASVVSPLAVEGILQNSEEFDISVLHTACAKKDRFEETILPDREVFELLDELNIYRICFSRRTVEKLYFTDSRIPAKPMGFKLFFLSCILSGYQIGQTSGEICIYEAPKIDISCDDVDLLEFEGMVLDNMLDGLVEEDQEKRVKVFEWCMEKLYRLLESQKYGIEIQERAYGLMKEIGEDVCTDRILNRFYELYLGVPYVEAAVMEYPVYRKLRAKAFDLKNAEKSVYDIKAAMNHAMAPQRAAAEKTNREIVETRKNVTEMNKRMEALSAEVGLLVKNLNSSQRNSIADPIKEVPQLFAEGRLGLKILFRSFGAWLRCKLGRKRTK